MRNFIVNVREFISKLLKHDVFTRSAALAYYFIFSIFPSILFLYSVLGFFSIDWRAMLTGIKGFMPSDVYKIFENYIQYLTPKDNIMFLLTGLITANYSSYRAVKCIRAGLNLAYNSHGRRNIWQEMIRSIIFTGLLYVTVLVSLFIAPAVSGTLEIFSQWPGTSKLILSVWNSIKGIILFVPFLLCLSMLYCLSPYERIPIRSVFSGVIFSTVGISLLSSMLSIFTVNTFRYSRTYGSLAALVVFILWLYFVSLIILIGGEISATFGCKKSRNTKPYRRYSNKYS